MRACFLPTCKVTIGVTKETLAMAALTNGVEGYSQSHKVYTNGCYCPEQACLPANPMYATQAEHFVHAKTLSDCGETMHGPWVVTKPALGVESGLQLELGGNVSSHLRNMERTRTSNTSMKYGISL